MRNYFRLLFFLLVFISHASTKAERIGFASEEWKLIKTEHFDVIFTAKQQDLGLYYANQAEKAYANLATVFINRPERVILVVNDTTDISNGYATRIPYPHIMVYAVPIGDHQSLSQAGDWGRELVTHELTHIMQLEPALGIFKYIRPIFGSIVAPNLLTPLWWKEGMAVEMETQFSPQGRSRSYYQDAAIRTFVLDQKLFTYTIDQVNESLPSWPYGSRPYLFGSIFWSGLVRDAKLQGVNQLTSRQGERVPYFIEEPMRELTQRSYADQYNKTLNDVADNAHQQIAQLKTLPLDSIQPISLKGQSAFSPRWSEPFKILAFLEQIEDETEIQFRNEKGERLELKRRPKGTISQIDFHPTAQKILYSKAERLNSKYTISDLYIYNLENQKSDRLTINQRARDASFSEDGQRIVFISTFSGRTQIRLVDTQSKKLETLISSHFKERYLSPIFLNSNEIIYVKISENGSQKLHKINLSEKKEIPLDFNPEGIRFLRKKNNSLYFVSAENGVNNVYVTENFKTSTPVTHVPGGIWSFDINTRDQVVWGSHMTSEGFQVASVELKPRPALPRIENKFNTNYNYIDKRTPDQNYLSEDYSSGKYLIPSYWIPFVATSTTSNGVYIQAQTSGHDPVNIHEYSVLGSYDTHLQKGGFQGYYLNSTTSVPVQLAATIRNQALGTIDNIVETKTGSLGFLPDVFKISKNLNLQIGAQFQQTEINGSQSQHWGPFAQAQYVDYEQNIFRISPEKGWGAFLKYEHWKNLKESRDYNKILASVVGYFSPWLPSHHTMMVRSSALLTFESLPARFGTSNDSLFANSDLILPQFVLRGYTPSQFYGRSVWNANAEYRFPIRRLDYGSGTNPYFLKRISGALVTDGLGVEGGAITEDNFYNRTNLNQSFWSSGAEVKFETTIGYVLPMNFVLGVYHPHSPLYRSSTQFGLNIQIGGF